MNNETSIFIMISNCMWKKKFLPAALGVNKWLSASKFCCKITENSPASSLYKNGAKYMSKILHDKSYFGVKFGYLDIDVDVPLVISVGDKNQFEVKRDKNNNFVYRIIKS